MPTVGPGRVYVLLEPLKPKFVKIGFTRGETGERVRELHGTGRAVPLIAIWDEYVSDPERVEGALHSRFSEQRVSDKREFFAITPQTAVAALMHEAAPYRISPPWLEGHVNLFHRLYAKHGAILRSDIRRVEMIVTQEGVFILTVET
ncbi:T5orf172 domain-containing protein [Geodermatophilus amargosae]|uniref:T5orf172 domain-containing protein n=1 Tax=Geodermatophilus amargosae TaxID=1296565 RepID=A0A1I7DEH4_9ACTN|nr:GIY-YIG nuclease family protein [Geodermatophilus amargosae]SFU10131.1 T5orf172 domain-containing protein [Geodermatophilus amargosae]